MAESSFTEKINMDHVRNYIEECSTDVMTGGRNKRMQLYYQLVQSLFKTKGKGDASTEISYGIPAEITAFIDMDSEEYCLKKYRESEDGNARTKVQDSGIGKRIQKKVNSSGEILPLLCFQSDARVWQMRRGDFGKELKKKLNDRRCGYIGCLDYSLDIKGIQAWCLKMELAAFASEMAVEYCECLRGNIS